MRLRGHDAGTRSSRPDGLGPTTESWKTQMISTNTTPPLFALLGSTWARRQIQFALHSGNALRIIGPIIFASGWQELRDLAARFPGSPAMLLDRFGHSEEYRRTAARAVARAYPAYGAQGDAGAFRLRPGDRHRTLLGRGSRRPVAANRAHTAAPLQRARHPFSEAAPFPGASVHGREAVRMESPTIRCGGPGPRLFRPVELPKARTPGAWCCARPGAAARRREVHRGCHP